jgi:hypothetical protein
LRTNGYLLDNFRLIWVIQCSVQKYSAFHPTQISGAFSAVPSRQQGRFAIVTNARRDAVDAAASGAKSCLQGRSPVSEHGAQDVRR